VAHAVPSEGIIGTGSQAAHANNRTEEATDLERRLHTRHRARTSVYITTPGGRRRLCKAVNLSATGVFIETTNLGLRKGQHVELAFAIDLGAITKLHRRTAVVAHVSRGGTGLMMEAYSAVARSG
jgi:PilZ domain